MEQAFDELANVIKNKQDKKFINDVVLQLKDND